MREVIVAFRVTEPERDRLKLRAEENNQSVSDLIRTELLKQ
jgi:hypothetical protein